MEWLTSLVQSLANVGWPTVAGIGAILVVVVLLWFNIRSLTKSASERESLANERKTYERLSETLQSRRRNYEELMEELRRERQK